LDFRGFLGGLDDVYVYGFVVVLCVEVGFEGFIREC